MDKLLNKTKDLKVKIIAKLSMDKDDMLVVTVNRNWPLLSRDQKQESVETIHESWKELDGGAIEFRNIKGHVVASLNRASQLIHGRATFIIEDGK